MKKNKSIIILFSLSSTMLLPTALNFVLKTDKISSSTTSSVNLTKTIYLSASNFFSSGTGISGLIGVQCDTSNFTCSISDAIGLTVTDGEFKSSIPVTINDQTETYQITSIGDEAFSTEVSYLSIQGSLKLPASISSLGKKAFFDEILLEKIDLSSCTNLTVLPYSCFTDCQNLKNVILPPNLETIEDMCFYGNDQMTTIKVPSSLTSIGSQAFNCGIEEIDLSNTKITTLTHYSFLNASNLQSIELPQNLEKIEYDVFDGCQSLSKIELPNTLKVLSDGAFIGCESLTEINIPSSVTVLGNEREQGHSPVFINCTNLKDVYLNWTPEQIENLSVHTHEWLSNISPDAVIHVPTEYFDYYLNCDKLYLSNFQLENDSLDINNWINGATGDISIGFITSSKTANILNVNNVSCINPTINDTFIFDGKSYVVSSINSNLFENQTNISGNVSIQSGITSIGANAFNGCVGIDTISLMWTSQELTNISLDSNWLGNLNNSNTTISVNSSVFKFYLDNASTLGINNCILSTSVNLDSWIGNASGKMNILYDLSNNQVSLDQIEIYEQIVDPVINSKIVYDNDGNYLPFTSIPDEIFKDNTNLVGSLTIDSGINSIGALAFDGCSNIDKLYLQWTDQQLTELLINSSWIQSLNTSSISVFVPIEYFDSYITEETRNKLGINNCSLYSILEANKWIENATGEVIVTPDYETNGLIIEQTVDVKATNPYIKSEVQVGDKTFNVIGLDNNLFQNNKNLFGVLTIDKNIVKLGENVFNGCNNIEVIHLSWTSDELTKMIAEGSIQSNWTGSLNANNVFVTFDGGQQEYEEYTKIKNQIGLDNCIWLVDNVEVSNIINNAVGTCYLYNEKQAIEIIRTNITEDIINPSINSSVNIEDISTPIVAIRSGAFANNNHLIGTFTIPNTINHIGANVFDGSNNINEFNLEWTTYDLWSLNIDDTWLGSLNNQNTKINVDSLWLEDYVNNKSNLGIDQCLVQSTINTDSWMDNSSGTINITYNSDLDMMSILEISLTNDLVDPTLTNTINVNGKDYLIDGINDNLFQNNNYISGNLTIDSSISSIGANVFDGCNNISTITLTWTAEQLNEWFADGANYSNINPNWLGSLNNPNTTINVPEGLEAIYHQYAEQLGINLCALPAIPKNLVPIIVPSVLGSILAIGVCAGVGIKINNRKKIKHLIRKGQKDTKKK